MTVKPNVIPLSTIAKPKLAPKKQAEAMLQDILSLGIRGDLRSAIEHALAISNGTKAVDLTNLHYDRLKPGAKLLDPQRPGLLMRNGKRTGKVWIYRFMHPVTKKQTELQFGTYPKTSIADARSSWRELANTRATGKLPVLINTRTPVSYITLGELVRRYVDFSFKHNSSPVAQATKSRLERFLVKQYGDLPVTDVTPNLLRPILYALQEETPRSANILRSDINNMFNVARGRTNRESFLETWLPADAPNPVETVYLKRHISRAYAATTNEISNFFGNLHLLDENWHDLFLMQAQTFARVSEVAGISWAEVDLNAGRWHLPEERAKNKHAHTVMLSRQSLDLLGRRKKNSTSKFVFPSLRSADYPVSRSTTMRVLQTNRKALGVTDNFTSHVLRRAGLTWLAEQGYSREVRDRVSNHLPSGTGGVDHIYTATAQHTKPATEATQSWCDHLDALSDKGGAA